MRNLFKLKNQESQRGAAVVEFAIILPILVILIAGIIEFSLLLYNQQVITNASREGARASINPINKLDFDSGNPSIESIVTAYSNDKLVTFGGTDLVNVSYQINGNTNVSFSDRDYLDNVSIIVQYEYHYLMPQIIRLGTTKNITSKTIMQMM